jgi:hypothetical protein
MPLRQPAAPEPAAGGPGAGQAIAEAPALSLGRQIYARGIKDARMTLMGPLATNVRRSVQRQAAAAGPVARPQGQTLAGPLPLMGLARSAAARTSLLPQARVQREGDERPAPQNQLVPYAPSRTEPTGTLPLAPPGPAPINPNQSPPTPTPPSTSPRPSANSQALTLAPVISRDGGESGTTSDSPSTAGNEIDRDLNDLLAGLEDDSVFDDVTDEDEIDLDNLAEQILPIIRRLLTIERERNQPT